VQVRGSAPLDLDIGIDHPRLLLVQTGMPPERGVNDGVLSAQNARSIFRTALTNKAQGQTMMLGAAIEN
jgi:hypothetical protein